MKKSTMRTIITLGACCICLGACTLQAKGNVSTSTKSATSCLSQNFDCTPVPADIASDAKIISKIKTTSASIFDKASIFNILTPEIVELYENDIAKKSVVSHISAVELNNICRKYKIPANKARALLIISDFSKMVGMDKDMAMLLDMNDLQIMRFARQCGEEYEKTLSPEKKAELKEKVSKTSFGKFIK